MEAPGCCGMYRLRHPHVVGKVRGAGHLPTPGPLPWLVSICRLSFLFSQMGDQPPGPSSLHFPQSSEHHMKHMRMRTRTHTHTCTHAHTHTSQRSPSPRPSSQHCCKQTFQTQKESSRTCLFNASLSLSLSHLGLHELCFQRVHHWHLIPEKELPQKEPCLHFGTYQAGALCPEVHHHLR